MFPELNKLCREISKDLEDSLKDGSLTEEYLTLAVQMLVDRHHGYKSEITEEAALTAKFYIDLTRGGTNIPLFDLIKNYVEDREALSKATPSQQSTEGFLTYNNVGGSNIEY